MATATHCVDAFFCLLVYILGLSSDVRGTEFPKSRLCVCVFIFLFAEERECEAVPGISVLSV